MTNDRGEPPHLLLVRFPRAICISSVNKSRPRPRSPLPSTLQINARPFTVAKSQSTATRARYYARMSRTGLPLDLWPERPPSITTRQRRIAGTVHEKHTCFCSPRLCRRPRILRALIFRRRRPRQTTAARWQSYGAPPRLFAVAP